MKDIPHLLKKAGLRCTRARIAVLSLLHHSGHPMSHRDLERHPGLDGMDRVTLYRTLHTLAAAGILHKIQGMDGVKRYSTHQGHSGCHGNHLHFLCLSCDRMMCLPDRPMPWVDVPNGFEVKGKQFLIYGYCDECRKAIQVNTCKAEDMTVRDHAG